MSEKRTKNIRYLVVARHAPVEPAQSEDPSAGACLSDDGKKIARSLTRQIIAKLPPEVISLAKCILVVTTSRTRAVQSLYSMMNELGVDPVTNDFIRTETPSGEVADRILREATASTRLVVVMCHKPQVNYIPHKLLPSVPDPFRNEGCEPGQAYFIDLEGGKGWEIITGTVNDPESEGK